MTEVSIKQDSGSSDLTLDATVGGTTRQLISSGTVRFQVDDGVRYLYLEGVSATTADTEFKLTFRNAQRWNGNRYLKDVGFDGYRKRFRLYIPGVPQ